MSTNMSLARSMAFKGCRILRSPGDGHCLLYSLVSSWTNQLPQFSPIDLELVKSHIFIQPVQNADQYLPFLQPTNRVSLFVGLRSYLINRHYNQAFGDIVPAIISNAFQVNLNFYNEAPDHSYETITVAPWSVSSNQISVDIHRQGDHYNGIVPCSLPISTSNAKIPCMSIGITSAHSAKPLGVPYSAATVTSAYPVTS